MADHAEPSSENVPVQKGIAVTVKIGKRFQVVLPKKARQRLDLREGDELIVEVSRRGLLFVPKPKSYTMHLAGLHRGVWDGLDPEVYLEDVRKTWRHE